MTDLLDAIVAAHRDDIESEPFPTFEHLLETAPKTCVCGLPMAAMVYQWRPDGGSVYEPKCRDCKDVQS